MTTPEIIGSAGGDTNPSVILSNLRAENKLLRRKTLTGILDGLKSLGENFDRKCRISSGPAPTQALVVKKRQAIKVDSDDEEEPDDIEQSGEDVDIVQQSSNELVAVFGNIENLVKSLVLSISDPVEKCRELSFQSLSHVVEMCGKQTTTRFLPIILPVLVQRLAQPELIEPSEEVRLLAVEFIHKLIQKCRKDLSPFIDDLLAIMICTLGDPFHEVRIKSCEVTTALAKTLKEVFHYNSESLVKPLCLSLTHQQSRVRKSVVECIGDVLQFGSHKPAETYVGHLVQRLFDPNPSVRKSTVSVVANWMLDFSDRYSHFHRFIPVILTGLSDESPDVASLAENLWSKVGDKYLEENHEEYKDLIDFPPEPPKHYPVNVRRPNLGCRVLTHREVCKLFPGITREIMDWQESNREKSAQLLYYLILMCEDKMTMHVEPLFHCMFRACLDANPVVIKYVLQSVSLFGYFIPVSTCWPLLQENLKCNPSEGCLAVIAAYLKGVNPEQLPEYLNEIMDLVASPEVSQTLHQGKLNRILCICETVLALTPEAVAEQCPETLFRILLNIVSMSSNEDIIRRAQESMDVLKQFCGFPSVDELFGLYSGAILQEVKDADVEWTMMTPQRLVFTSILTQAGSGIQRNIDLVLEILMSYLGPKRDADVRLSLFTELSAILRIYSEIREQEEEEMPSKTLEQIQLFVKTIVQDILSKNLAWRAGKTAGALRAAALNCLLTILLGNLLNTEHILSVTDEISNGCVSLLDDQLYLNRLFSTKCLGELAVCCDHQMEIHYINKIYPDLLKRLDDENKDVRIAASKAITQIYSSLPPDYTLETFKAYFDHVLGVLIVHLDDRDKDIQNAVFDTMLLFGSICPEIVISKCENFKCKHRTPDNCNRLLSKLKTL